MLAALQVASNDNDGVAEALEKYILAPAGITLQANASLIRVTSCCPTALAFLPPVSPEDVLQRSAA